MENAVLYNIIGIIAVLSPIALLLAFGPERNRRRLSYGIIGLVVAGIIGLLLYLFAADTRFDFSDPWQGRLARDITAAITEELIRYPGLLLAEYITISYIIHKDLTGESEDTPPEELDDDAGLSRFVKGKFTKISDPHGMALYFGVGYGLGETIVFYIVPTIQELISGDVQFYFPTELLDIVLRVTAVMAHVSLTYLAMAITSQKGFWRITILVHLTSNVINRVFEEFGPNIPSIIVFIIFTRFAIVLIAYFLLRPRIRYLSPAVLVLILVTLFLLVILISSVVALLISFLTVDLFP